MTPRERLTQDVHDLYRGVSDRWPDQVYRVDARWRAFHVSRSQWVELKGMDDGASAHRSWERWKTRARRAGMTYPRPHPEVAGRSEEPMLAVLVDVEAVADVSEVQAPESKSKELPPRSAVRVSADRAREVVDYLGLSIVRAAELTGYDPAAFRKALGRKTVALEVSEAVEALLDEVESPGIKLSTRMQRVTREDLRLALIACQGKVTPVCERIGVKNFVAVSSLIDAFGLSGLVRKHYCEDVTPDLLRAKLVEHGGNVSAVSRDIAVDRGVVKFLVDKYRMRDLTKRRPESVTRESLLDALQACQWRARTAAKRLGCSRHTVKALLGRYGLLGAFREHEAERVEATNEASRQILRARRSAC